MTKILLAVLFMLSAGILSGQEKSESTSMILTRCSLESIGGRLRARCDLGSLPLNSVVPVRMLVYNPLNTEVELGKFFSGCSCIEATTSRESIPSQDAAIVTIKLTTPKIARTVDQDINLLIAKGKEFQDKILGASIRITYQLAGLAAFRERRIVAIAAPGDKYLTFRTPLVVGESFDSRDLAAKGTGALSDMSANIFQVDGEHYCECTLKLDGIQDRGLTGELHVIDKDGKTLDSVLCTAMLQPHVVVSPNPITLTWSANDKLFHSTGIVRIVTGPSIGGDAAPSRTASQNEMVISGMIGDSVVLIESKHLTQEIARFNFTVTPEVEARQFADSPKSNSLTLTVSLRGTTRSVKIPVTYDVSDL